MTVKILLVDDHPNVRRGLRKILDQSSQIEVIGEAGDGKTALSLAEEMQPDLLLLDVEMPGMKGYEVARHLSQGGSETRILAISAYDEKNYILGMFASGAAGYLTKDEAPQQLLLAVEEIAAGRRGWISPKVALRLGVPAKPSGQETIPALTKMEVRILKAAINGKSDAEILEELNIESSVLAANIQSLFRKLAVNTRLGIILRAIQEDLISNY
ncbi:MAG: response regulator transcription factor [Anaerolineales bacterium]|jgi:DNA-binding NarL/FixJ family response regulator|nr:response regulator transcription factor [Anaerolineales bacterium]